MKQNLKKEALREKVKEIIAKEVLMRILSGVGEEDVVYTEQSNGSIYQILHTYFPSSEREVTISLIIPEACDGMTVCTLQDGWLDVDEVKKEIEPGGKMGTLQ